ncbi:C-C chemokine receptor type 8-like [Polypterus senegalus]|uniref:C-C chemokine receptor type 8-like n=1 Tax=Polypterus senegalus TaxID=55291 RepID=UPI0019657299|nr:C-C chemokine receptor type 8-like [Polypterus senegalus]
MDELTTSLNNMYDTISNEVECDDGDIETFGKRFMPAFYFTIFTLSTVANGLVLYILFKYEKLERVTNIFILNLVLSNIIFASFLPFWAIYHRLEWVFGNVMCKLSAAAFFIGFYSSVIFLTLMTVDRYLIIVHSIFALKTRRKRYAFLACSFVWCLSLLTALPKFFLYNTFSFDENGLLCEESGYVIDVINRWKLISNFQQMLLFFLIPLVVMCYCYARIGVVIIQSKMVNKSRVLIIIFITVVLFFLCWTPYNIVIFLESLNLLQSSNQCDNLDYPFYICKILSYLHCCINPIFFTFVGKKFRRHLFNIFKREILCIGVDANTSVSDRRYVQTMNN